MDTPYFSCRRISVVTAISLVSVALCVTALFAEVDLDGNGLGDVWEQRFQLTDSSGNDDPDGDGRTNGDENLAGTDPLKSDDFLKFSTARLTDGALELEWESERGKRYEIEVTNDFKTWDTAVPPRDGSGDTMSLRLRSQTSLAGVIGGVNRDVWLDITGESIDDLTADPAYPDTASGTFSIAEAASDENEGDDYGARLRGYLLPEVSGTYSLAIEGMDHCELSLGRSADTDSLESLLEVTGGTRASRSVQLESGKAYYLEVLHKAGQGRDFFNFMWQLPGRDQLEVISGENLAFWLGDAVIDSAMPMSFFRLRVGDVDSDDDGATDWEEFAMGYHPFDPESQVAGISDGQVLISELGGTQGTAVITYEILVGNGYEEGDQGEPVAAEIAFQRDDGDPTKSLVVNVGFSGTAVQDEDFEAVEVVFDPGVMTVELAILPIKDAHIEVPETVIVEVLDSEAYESVSAPVTVTVEDHSVQEPSLYVASLTPEDGVDSTATGISSLWLSGDRLSCTVAISFQGLTSEQTAAHIHLVESGAAVESLELGEFSDHLWEFPADGQGALTSAQEILDTLTSGGFYVNVHSAVYPAGEIRGDYYPSDGSDTFEPPSDPPAVPDYTGDQETRDFIRLLTQATFGPTEDDLEELRSLGVETWIDQQMNAEFTLPTNLLNYNQAADAWEVARNDQLGVDGDPAYDPEFHPRHNNRRRGWYLGAIKGNDQLRQRVAFALSEIFVISDENTQVKNHQYGAASYYDMLASHAFGNYRELLEDVTLHPMMGNYLSMIYNEKANPDLGTSPDENYAREVMQLFSIGLVQLHPDGSVRLDAGTLLPIPTYDNFAITELARIFTGWSYAKRWVGDQLIDNTRFYGGGGPRYRTGVTNVPMKMFPDFHDTGEKTIVGGVTIPAGQSGEQDMEDALDALFNHSNTPPFVSRRLIQRLVTSNPSRGYVYRVAQTFENNGTGVRGDLGAVITAILTDYEARSLDVADEPEFGKQKEPLIRFISIMRALNTNTNLPVEDLEAFGFNNEGRFPSGTGRFRFGDTTNLLSQSPLSSPSVFNWFMPDYVFPGIMAESGMVGPEFQTTTETWVVKSANYKYGLLFGPNGLGLQALRGDRTGSDHAIPDFTRLQEILDSEGVDGLINHLDKFWTGSAMSSETKVILSDVLGGTLDSLKVQTAVYLTVVSPDFIIQR